MIVSDESGRLVVEEAPDRNRLLGSYWRRIVPRGDAGDHVQIVGTTVISIPDEARGGMVVSDALSVTTTTYGAVPPGWGSSVEAFAHADFRDEFELSERPSAALAEAEAKLATIEAETARFELRAADLARLQRRADEINAEKGNA